MTAQRFYDTVEKTARSGNAVPFDAEILLMFVKLIFEDFEHFENRKRVTLTRPAIAGQIKASNGSVTLDMTTKEAEVNRKYHPDREHYNILSLLLVKR